MAESRLIWIGVVCSICALLVNLFPALAFELGMDRGGAWQLFAFGVFLVLTGVLLAMLARPRDRSGGP